MEFQWCRFDGERTVTSSVTGRILRVNETDKMYIPPDRDYSDLKRILGSFETSHWTHFSYRARPRGKYLDMFRELAEQTECMGYASSLNKLITYIAKLIAAGESWGRGSRLIDLLVRLHAEGCLALPMHHNWARKVIIPDSEWPWGDNFQFHKNLSAFTAITAPKVGHDFPKHWISKLFLACQGAKDIGDLTPEVDGGLLFRTHGDATSNNIPSVGRILLQTMRAEYPDAKIDFKPQDYGTNAPSVLKSDGSVTWALADDPSLGSWVELLATWLSIAKTAYKINLTAVNSFVNYLIQHPSITRNPLQYVRNDYTPEIAYFDWVQKKLNPDTQSYREYINRIRDFFAWLLIEKCSEGGFISPAFENPVQRVAYSSTGQAETHRTAMPVHFMRMLKDIVRAPYTINGDVGEELTTKLVKLKYVRDNTGCLVGDMLTDKLQQKLEEAGALIDYGFRWPRTQNDYYTFTDRDKVQPVEVWSPVRTYAMLLKLELPLRTFQVRVLDSGEMDAEMFEPGRGWIANPGPLAGSSGRSGKKSRPMGAIRRFVEQTTGETFNGLYINTNKTADRNKSASKKGYEIPWENKEAIRILSAMGQFQRRFNPIAAPCPWAGVTELTREFRKDDLEDRGTACFLFRDPKGDDPEQPVTDARMQGYWVNLLKALEEKVDQSGMRLRDGSKIKFVIEKTSLGKRRSKYINAVYDLHSLRVSLITAFAERGVSISILSKFVAGHATVVMTLYYSKFGPAYITDVMNEASKGMEEAEQENYRRFLMDHAFKQIIQVAAFNDEASVVALKEVNPGSWVSDDRGICPTGCARCHEGGELKRSVGLDVIKDVYDPVRGGQNCVLCRFFITGPAYLPGLSVHFNEIGWNLSEKSRRFRELDEKMEILEEERYLCDAEGRPFLSGHDLESIGKLLQRVTDELDIICNSWQATKRLVDRCLAPKRPPGEEEDEADSDEKLSLVLAGTRADVEAAIFETTQFELADSICQSAVFYESVDATMPSLRRADMIDAMLSSNHRRPVFVSFSDEDKLRIGNQVTKLIAARIGREDTMALMAGKETLERLELDHSGLSAEMDNLVGTISSSPFQLTINQAGRSKRRDALGGDARRIVSQPEEVEG